ncbi:anhydro-N-acetylmuramic acid kinase [Acetobacter orleanensis]|uniref:Anhydro-N-acetylmuramic acid kinase n=1 Tax=Acetobacter orleanensis TaxID=104099 RepID=A0A4Y3TR27_9PROT|nr:anhydro-N-acetylmuramic acid kinase [Acetobacter orleanensis]PCD78793.1 anhydro-N-acetylmuramic acid kinase [Acetobacter orleanensis]GAN69540.1 anhydro-N-acetylmuramic acid kinase [Acetobacter orleanensis JCM 7639]GBR23449.1 anhydro-N-acetylmuramic acid kinase [Acetobacter orleanensis NRIC 0473]GEB83909.1 anhydro-N-acetylmuramic acid kinase [Acetobacter orleanensis]
MLESTGANKIASVEAGVGAPLTTIGLMSGTSLDGVDAALITTDGVRVLHHGPALTIPYEAPLRARLRTILDRAASLAPNDAELLNAEDALTDVHTQAVQAVRAQAGNIRVDVLGLHGQTILHAPGRTWQIGNASRLSAATDLPVVHDFRTADVQAGGEGAPLAPLYHAALLHEHTVPVAVLNIGGVANLTLITRAGDVLACDTGPGNALLDDWMFRHTGQPCDFDGACAASGTVDTASLSALMAHDFFRKPPPKSLDRLTFHQALEQISSLSVEDGAATLTAFTAAAIASTPLPEQPLHWFICGGGRRNPTLMRMLAEKLSGTVQPVEALGWNGDALEAECFGFLAVRSLRGLPLSLPATTGVPFPTPGGRLTCGGINPADRKL